MSIAKTTLAAITDADEIVAEAERLLAREDPDLRVALAAAHRAVAEETAG